MLQQGCVTFHILLSQVAVQERTDYISVSEINITAALYVGHVECIAICLLLGCVVLAMFSPTPNQPPKQGIESVLIP
jgi:hypothetical protein